MPRENFLDRLVAKHRRNGVLVDANLLLLYLVGRWDYRLVPKFKRTDRYTVSDFILLTRFLAQFAKILTTPNVLTEVSNLCGNMREHVAATFLALFEGAHILRDCVAHSLARPIMRSA